MGLLSRIFPPSLTQQVESQHKRWRNIPGLSPVLQQLLATPVPNFTADVFSVPWLAFDFETSGLDANQDRILSIGSVMVQSGQILLASAQHQYISSDPQVNAHSAVINHITPEMLRDGEALDEAMETLFLRLAGRVAVVHGKMVERAFINAWLQTRYGAEDLPILWIDTLEIERRYQQARRQMQNDLRLSSLRREYRLPDYPAHHALCDAVATAELALVQLQPQRQARAQGKCLPLNACLCG